MKILITASFLFIFCGIYAQDRKTLNQELLESTQMVKDIEHPPSKEKETIHVVVEQMPQFPGGDRELMRYLSDSLKYPVVAKGNGIQGRVVIRFYIDIDGSINDIQTIRSIDPVLDSAYIEVVKNMPKWIPGVQDGKNVPVYFTLPIQVHFK